MLTYELFLLKATFDDEAFGSVDAAAGAEFGEQVTGDVFVAALHALADVGDVGEDGLLVPFAETLRGGDLIALGSARHHVRMIRVHQPVKPAQQL